MQRAFVDAGAVQCGFCTPGLIVAVHDLLDRDAVADRDRDPRAAGRQRLPVHRLRPDHRRRPAGGRAPAGAGAAREHHRDRHRRTDRHRHPSRHDRHLADAARRHRQGPGRVRVLVRPVRRRLPVGRHAALAASVRRGSCSIDLSAAWKISGVEAIITADDVPGSMTYGLISQDQPVFAVRRRALRRRADRRRRRRSSRDVPACARRDRRRVRGARAAARSRGGDRRQPPADPPRRQRDPPPAHRVRRHDASPATWSSRARTRSACRTRRSSGSRRRWRSPTPAARASSCTSPPSGCTRTATRSRPASACPTTRCGLMLGGVGGAFGGPRGHQPPGAHLPAGAAARAAGAHRLQPGRELPRSRPPPPGDDLDAPPRHQRRRDRQDRGADGVRRRRLRVDVVGGADQRHHPHAGPVPVRQRRRRRLRRAHQPSAVRGDARVRRGAGVLRPRIADGPAGRGVRARPRRDPAAQRDAAPATR